MIGQPTSPIAKTIYGQVLQAKYYPSQKSIVVVVRDIESNREVKPVQIHASSFSFPDPNKIDEEMEKTAGLMLKCRFPIRIAFEPQTLDEERAWFGDMDAVKRAYGDEWADYVQQMAKMG